MASTPWASTAKGPGVRTGWRGQASKILRRGMEAAVLVMACLSPWAFGAVEPRSEFFLDVGVAVLLVAWGARMLLDGRFWWQKCPVALCLAALALLAAWQFVPLPQGLVRWLSPATTRMVEQLLPAQAEVLPFGEPSAATSTWAGSTLSLYPGCTGDAFFRLLAVFLLFASVNNNLASPGSLRRLSLAALVNGSALAFFAILQFFTSRDFRVYWTWPTVQTAFGPFINRNHFAFYMNLCIGLAVGFLFGSKYFALGSRRGDSDQGSSTPLQNPATLWTIAGLALMVSSVLFSASRGGVVALLGGWIVFVLMSLLQSVRFRRVGAILLILSLALALAGWFGLDRVQARFATLGEKEALQEGRLELWARLLPFVKEFPVWGTGYGTFPYLEPLCRNNATQEVIFSNVENEYLEGLLEGGLFRLAVSLLAVGLVFWLGYRAVRTGESPMARGLAMGALFAFTTAVIHSSVDFGLHIPAIAVMTTVLAATLCGVGHRRTPSAQGGRSKSRAREQGLPEESHRSSDAWSVRLGGLAPALGALVATLCGALLTVEGWRAARVEELRQNAVQMEIPSESPVAADAPERETTDVHAQRIGYLTAATRLAPASARLQVDLALAYYDNYKEQRIQLQIRNLVLDMAQAWCDFTPARSPLLAPHPALAVSSAWMATAQAREELSKFDEKPIVRTYLVPTLRHLIQARDLCPLLPEPQRIFAENIDQFEQADAASAYLERARFLVPSDFGLWFRCGLEWLEKNPERTWKYWRRSLELSDQLLPVILQQSAARLGPEEILHQVLPDQPKIIFTAAMQLFPEPTAQRQQFLDHALALLEQQPTPMKAEDVTVKALIFTSLGRSEEALKTYETALAQAPGDVKQRFEFAQLLYQQKRLQETRRELLIVLFQQPDHPGARELLPIVERQIAEGTPR